MVNAPSKKPEVVCPFCREKGDATITGSLEETLDACVYYRGVCTTCGLRAPGASERPKAVELWRSIKVKLKPTVRKSRAGWGYEKTTRAHYFRADSNRSLCGYIDNGSTQNRFSGMITNDDMRCRLCEKKRVRMGL